MLEDVWNDARASRERELDDESRDGMDDDFDHLWDAKIKEHVNRLRDLVTIFSNERKNKNARCTY